MLKSRALDWSNVPPEMLPIQDLASNRNIRTEMAVSISRSCLELFVERTSAFEGYCHLGMEPMPQYTAAALGKDTKGSLGEANEIMSSCKLETTTT